MSKPDDKPAPPNTSGTPWTIDIYYNPDMAFCQACGREITIRRDESGISLHCPTCNKSSTIPFRLPF